MIWVVKGVERSLTGLLMIDMMGARVEFEMLGACIVAIMTTIYRARMIVNCDDKDQELQQQGCIAHWKDFLLPLNLAST